MYIYIYKYTYTYIHTHIYMHAMYHRWISAWGRQLAGAYCAEWCVCRSLHHEWCRTHNRYRWSAWSVFLSVPQIYKIYRSTYLWMRLCAYVCVRDCACGWVWERDRAVACATMLLMRRGNSKLMRFNATMPTPMRHTATQCNTLQHTATRCNTQQRTATHCNVLQRTATHCNTLQRTATHYNALQRTAMHCNALQRTATHRNTPQRTVTHYNTLDYCATQQQPFQFITATATRHDILLYVSTPLYFVKALIQFHSCHFWKSSNVFDSEPRRLLQHATNRQWRVCRQSAQVECCVAVCCSVLQCRQSSQSAQDSPHWHTHFVFRCAYILRGDKCAYTYASMQPHVVHM